MTISTTDQLIAALTGGQSASPTAQQRFPVYKTQSFTTVAGFPTSLWLATGYPTAGSTPSTAAVVTSSTTGTIPVADPAGSHTLYLARVSAFMGVNGGVAILYDRLIHQGGLSGTSVASQSVSTPALPSGRCDSNGIGVEAFVECYTQLGATPQTLTVTYTNQAGTSGQTTTVSIPANFRQGGLLPIPLSAGDTGFKSIESVQLGGSTGTAGNFGITMAQRIIAEACPFTGVGDVRGPIEVGLPTLHADAALWFAVLCATTTLGSLYGDVLVIEN